MLNNVNYNSGTAINYQNWIGKYSNCCFDYFAKHRSGKAIQYKFNSLGYRGPEHYIDPDISIFGSSFSFGVGINFEQCWHQKLGNYKINCYAPAGFLVTNNDIIDHFNQVRPSGITILQLREFKYNTEKIQMPTGIHCFVIDETTQPDLFTFDYSSFEDKAEDNVHPGPKTHTIWATTIKQMFSL